jgi:hypothetical protein
MEGGSLEMRIRCFNGGLRRSSSSRSRKTARDHDPKLRLNEASNYLIESCLAKRQTK